MIMRFTRWDDIVASKVNGVRSRNFEESGLALGNSDIKGLLTMLNQIISAAKRNEKHLARQT